MKPNQDATVFPPADDSRGLGVGHFIVAHAARYGFLEAVILDKMILFARELADHFSRGEQVSQNPCEFYVRYAPADYCSSLPFVDKKDLRKALARLLRRGALTMDDGGHCHLSQHVLKQAALAEPQYATPWERENFGIAKPEHNYMSLY
jgi:hypothetical protein